MYIYIKLGNSWHLNAAVMIILFQRCVWSKFLHRKLGSGLGLSTRDPTAGALPTTEQPSLTRHLASLLVFSTHSCLATSQIWLTKGQREKALQAFACQSHSLPLFSGLRSHGINQSDSASKSFNVQEASPPRVPCPSFNRLLESAGTKKEPKSPFG